MATVVIPATILFGDGTPNICFKTGEATSDRVKVTYATFRMPMLAVVLFALCGLLPFLIVYVFGRISVIGTLAMSLPVAAQMKTVERLTLVSFVLGSGLLLASFPMTSATMLLIGIFLLFGTPFINQFLKRWVLPRGRVFQDGGVRYLCLEGVHQAFADALAGKPGIKVEETA